MKKAIAILSGGLDSAVNLAWGAAHFEMVLAITFDYGQRAAKKEIERSRLLCNHYRIPHEVIALPFLSEWTATSLVNRKASLPNPSPEMLDNRLKTVESAKAVWVPNRNGIFINAAAARAESLDADALLVGFNKEEGATFPDNTREFLEAANRALSFSTMCHITVECKTLSMTKKEIVKLGLELKVPFEYLWSCYEGDERMCGRCESCLRLKRAVAATPLLETIAFAH